MADLRLACSFEEHDEHVVLISGFCGAFDLLRDWSVKRKGFWSKERPLAKASNSELRRWLEKRSVQINGLFPGPDDPVFLPIRSFVLFAKSERSRNTLR